MDYMEQEGAEWDRDQLQSGSLSSEYHTHAGSHMDSRADVYKIVEKFVQRAIEKLYDRVINIID